MKRIISVLIVFLSIMFSCKHEIVVTTTVPQNLLYTPSVSTIIAGTAGNSVTPSINNGGGTIGYSISGTGVTGISINSKTGVISWSTVLATGTYNITVTAANSVGSTATTYTLNVNSGLTAPLNLTYAPSGTTIVFGTSGSSATPSINTGGSTISYSLTGTIPAGVSINNSTGVISWSSAVAVGTYPLTITASNSLGSTTTTYTLTITKTATVVAPSSFSYSPSNSSVTQGVAGSSATPTINNGLGTITYTLTGTIPAGISISGTTGIISWNTTVNTGTYALSVQATNSAGSVSATYSLTVNAAASNGTVCFSTQILPLYTTYCAISGCHNSGSRASGVELDTYATIMNGINANNPNSSKYYTVIGGKMPPRSSGQMTTTQIALIAQWINEGATNSACTTSTCDTTQYTYTNGISALFANNCNGCHGVAPGSGNVVLSDYTSAMTAGTTLKANFLNAVNYSSATSAMNMPPTGQLTACQVTQITKWLNAGCPQ